MRERHHILEGEEGRIGAGLLGVDVEASPCDPTVDEGLVEGGLVDNASASRIDDADGRLDLAQFGIADESDSLRGLREVDGDEVALDKEIVKRHHSDPELRGPRRLDVWVIGNELNTEGTHPLGDEDSDSSEAHDADNLVGNLDAVVLRSLPFATVQGLACRNDVACACEQQRHREFCRGDDVRGRGIDDHHASLSRGLHVDVIEPNACARHHLEVLRGRDRLCIDERGRANEDCVHIDDCGEERCPVSAVALDDLEIGAKGLDGGWGELFGDEDSALGHAQSLPGAHALNDLCRAGTGQWDEGHLLHRTASGELEIQGSHP